MNIIIETLLQVICVIITFGPVVYYFHNLADKKLKESKLFLETGIKKYEEAIKLYLEMKNKLDEIDKTEEGKSEIEINFLSEQNLPNSVRERLLKLAQDVNINSMEESIIKEVKKYSYDSFIDFLDTQDKEGIDIIRNIFVEYKEKELLSAVDGYIKTKGL